MSPQRLDPLSDTARELLAKERELVPMSAEFRHRALVRARAARRAGAHPSTLIGFWERWRAAILAAPALAISALAFADFGRSEAPEPALEKAVQSLEARPSAARPSLPASAPAVPPAPPALQGEAPSAEPAPAPRPSPPERRDSPSRNTEIPELRVLQRARAALAKGQYGVALGAVAEHQRQFPRGRLWEESEALRIKALVGLGKAAQAREAAESFRARYPRSVLLRRIDGSVATSP